MQRSLRTTFFFLCLLISFPIFANETISSKIIDHALQATIAIFPADPDEQAGGGSGVVISPDGYAVTNFHVVQPCGPAMKCAMSDGNLYDTVVVGLDPVGDIALIKLLGRTDFPYATFADSNTVAVGDIAIVMGNPFLLATDFVPSVSMGIISGTHRYQFPSGTFLEYTDCLQTDAAVNPGNSGGPLFNDSGEIVGIVGRCSFEKRGRVNVDIGYAVSSNQVRYFLGDLKSGRIVDHASLNAVVSTDREGRVMFDEVLATSDAYRSGLRYDDELLRFAGQMIDSANTLKNLLGIYPKQWRLPVTVRGKEGIRHEMLVRLVGLHGEKELIEMTQQMMEPPIVPEGKDKEHKEKQSILLKKPPPYLSEAIKPFYEEKEGYANYYFNRQEKDRVFQNWRAACPFDSANTWEISGTLKDRADTFSFQMDDQGVRFALPIENGHWDAELMLETQEFIIDPTTHYQSPRGSGGLFTALYLLRRLTQSDVVKDAEVVYTGTAPIGGNTQKLHDVCTAYWRGNEVRFYVDPDDGTMPLIEMFGSGLDFPCEIYFYGKSMEVWYGRILFGTFEIDGTIDGRRQMADGSGVEPQVADVSKIESLQKVVKIYGAESAGTHGYQSGIVISPDGYILTALTSALQTSSATVVSDGGRKFDAQLAAADPIIEIALLKITGSELPYFDIVNRQTTLYPLGLPVYAVSNPFNISQGNEHATIQKGTVAAQTILSARRGVFETLYKGEIIVVDMTTNNPGSCGGALIDANSGELIGMLGKELRNNQNNTWLNFAIPVQAWNEPVQSMIDQAEKGEATIDIFSEKIVGEQEMIPEDTIRILRQWGVVLIPSVSLRTPPFIDSIRAGSEAESQGLLPDDLIVMVNGQLTSSISTVESLIHQIPFGNPVTLTIERNMVLQDAVLQR